MVNQPTNYKLLKNTWIYPNNIEYFFVAYAVDGPIIDPKFGIRAGIPVDHPISGPVSEPSPLNTRYLYTPSQIPQNIL